jgi:large subunit ribosomal protein L31
MKGIHPERTITNVHCTSCGNVFATRSSVNELVLDVCSNCHPAYTGVAREVGRGSRVERFERRRARAAAAA